jgi:hypothetical protein
LLTYSYGTFILDYTKGECFADEVQRITKIGMEEPFSNKRGKEKDRV